MYWNLKHPSVHLLNSLVGLLGIPEPFTAFYNLGFHLGFHMRQLTSLPPLKCNLQAIHHAYTGAEDDNEFPFQQLSLNLRPVHLDPRAKALVKLENCKLIVSLTPLLSRTNLLKIVSLLVSSVLRPLSS